MRSYRLVLLALVLPIRAQAGRGGPPAGGDGGSENAVQIQVIRKGQAGQSKPGLVLIPNKQAEDLTANVACGGASAQRSGGAEAGERIVLELAVNPGTWDCTGHLSATFTDGTSGEMPLSFEVQMLAPLMVTVPRDRIDLDQHELNVILDRPASKVEVVAYGLDGTELGRGTAPADGVAAGTPIPVQWQSSPGEVLRLEVTGTDADGFWSKIELFPWYYSIPHTDVVFENNSAVIRPSETGKLEDAMKQVEEVVAKYGNHAVINLYVGGYTDRVGSLMSNLILSTKRAEAIARWFKQAGFAGPIYYQGFGEKGNAVKTPDETPEPRNRRAVYIVAAEPPPVSEAIPGSDWKKLE